MVPFGTTQVKTDVKLDHYGPRNRDNQPTLRLDRCPWAIVRDKKKKSKCAGFFDVFVHIECKYVLNSNLKFKKAFVRIIGRNEAKTKVGRKR